MQTTHTVTPLRFKWIKGPGKVEFVQFARARLSRSPFPLGGFIYTVSDNGKQLYTGNDIREAVAAIPNQ